MRRMLWALAVLLGFGLGTAPATGLRSFTWFGIDRVNDKLHGQVLDFTNNHHHDRRIWSNALCQKRDLYVYLPPGYDPAKQYPVMLYLHGIAQDEVSFLRLVQLFDSAIACGQLPPLIIGAPDGTLNGVPSVFNAGSFYVNSNAGRFEDYIIQDVWCFLKANFSINPDPKQHVLTGASMGGFGAFNLGIKHHDEFRNVAGLFPALHLRYLDCHGRYFADYDPCCLGQRERLAPLQPVGRFYGVIVIRERMLSQPLYGCNKEAINHIAAENPYEMIDAYHITHDDLAMMAGYGKHDEFNLDAQVEAFADKAHCKGLDFTSVCDPNGRHDTATGVRLFPYFCAWISEHLNNSVAAPTK